jgi:hypothetical protein
MLGRRLHHALTWSNRHLTDQLTILSRAQQEQEMQKVFDSFVLEVESQRPERALHLANHAVDEATGAQLAAVYPDSPMLAHIASRRQIPKS